MTGSTDVTRSCLFHPAEFIHDETTASLIGLICNVEGTGGSRF